MTLHIESVLRSQLRAKSSTRLKMSSFTKILELYICLGGTACPNLCESPYFQGASRTLKIIAVRGKYRYNI
jgi:hypothetical protein